MVEPHLKHEHSKKNHRTYKEGVHNSSELNLCKHFVYFSFLTALYRN